MCILMISNDPFEFKNGQCPKSPRVGGMHSGVTLDMCNIYRPIVSMMSVTDHVSKQI